MKYFIYERKSNKKTQLNINKYRYKEDTKKKANNTKTKINTKIKIKNKTKRKPYWEKNSTIRVLKKLQKN